MFNVPRSGVLSIACVLIVGLGAAAYAEEAAAPAAGGAAPAGSAVSAEQAKALWAKNCASCHGADAKGKTKMGEILKVRDLTDPTVRASFDRERMAKAIKEGVKKEGSDKPAMRAFADKLSDAEIAALVDYIYALK